MGPRRTAQPTLGKYVRVSGLFGASRASSFDGQTPSCEPYVKIRIERGARRCLKLFPCLIKGWGT